MTKLSLLFRILHSLNHIQLPLLMLSKVNIAIFRPFQCFRCLTKLIIHLNDEAIFVSMILYCLNHIQLPLLMLSKLNIAILRPFLFFHCLSKRVIRLNHEAIFIFRILHHIQTI